jgi:hypothetical protein
VLHGDAIEVESANAMYQSTVATLVALLSSAHSEERDNYGSSPFGSPKRGPLTIPKHLCDELGIVAGT